ncbi:MAG: HEAT repeat domain-containing protein [Planctomycetota bacterium]
MESRLLRVFTYFIYVIVFSQVACSQPNVNKTAISGNNLEAEAAARELRINRETLQQGSSEDIRVDAAVALLLQNTAQSRDVLLSALKSDDNPLARQAVCKALIKSRAMSQTIDSLEFFREPLLEILQSTLPEQAQLASEAMLLFDYSEIADSLMQVINNKELTSDIRINAVYALQLRPEPSALRGLIGLLDDSDVEVAKAAEAALQEAFGIPVGTSRDVWSDILVELQQKSPEEIRRERLLRQEVKLRQVQAERDRWQKLYLSLMDRHYEMLDEESRSKVILEMMDSELPPERLWSLDKASKYPDVDEELKKKIFLMLSDASRDIRLRTAKFLKEKSDLDPAEVLLAQFDQETDVEVRLAMFEALGEACYYAFSPNSPVELSAEIKGRTLEIAANYLRSDSTDAAIKGADVIRKILELNNLSSNSIESYLAMLSVRYQKSISESETLRAGLLSILAHLCGQGGAKAQACILYEPYFTEGLTIQDNDDLRLAAAKGLSYVDKVKALELFKQKGLMDDENLAVQQVVIDLAGQTGDASDLGWLLEALTVNGHNEQVWGAIKSICQRQKAGFLMEWLPTLETSDGVTAENVREVLEIAEQKAAAEKNETLQVQIQQEILSLLVGQKAWDKALTYLDKIGYDPSVNRFSSDSNASVLKILLYSNAAERACLMLAAELEKGDLSDTSPLKLVLEEYFSDEAVESDRKSFMLKRISEIPSGEHTNWPSLIESLNGQLVPPDVNEFPAEEGVAAQ